MMATTPGGSFPVIGMPTGVDAGHRRRRSGRRRLRDDRRAPKTSQQCKGKLKGKFVLHAPRCRDVPAHFEAPASATPTRSCADLAARNRRDPRGPAADAPADPGGLPAAAAAAARRHSRSAHAVPEGRRRRGASITPGPRRRRHGVRRRRRLAAKPTRPTPMRACRSTHRRRALRPHRAHAAERTCRCGSRWTSGTRSTTISTSFNVVARDAGHRQGRRGRDARRALRLVARAARARPTTPPGRR